MVAKSDRRLAAVIPVLLRPVARLIATRRMARMIGALRFTATTTGRTRLVRLRSFRAVIVLTWPTGGTARPCPVALSGRAGSVAV